MLLVTEMLATTLSHHLNDILETSDLYIGIPQWTFHCLKNLYHYRNRKPKEILCDHHNIRDFYWGDVIAGSKRDLKNILVLSVFLSYLLCLRTILMYQ